MVQETTLPATVQAAKADEGLTGNHPTSNPNCSWLTPHCAQRNRLQYAAPSTMSTETHSEDDETTQLKKKKNREAAQRCRLRKKKRYEELKKEKLDLSSKETTMKYKVSQLKKLKDELSRQLHDHSNSSNCKLNSSKCGLGLPGSAFTIDPAITRGLAGGRNLPSVDSLLPSAHVGVSQRNSAHMTATATTPATAGCDTPSATYFNTLQRSPVVAHNHSIANSLEEMPQTLSTSEDSIPAFSLLMKNDKPADVMSGDESNMDDGEENESIAGRLVVQSNHVLNNQSMGGLYCDNILNTPCTQHLNTNSMAGLNHMTRVISGSRFENLTSRSMLDMCGNTQVTTVSHCENNNGETGFMGIKSEQSVPSTDDDTMSDNTNEQTNSQTMSEPESWIRKTESPLPNTAARGSFPNPSWVAIPDFEQSEDGITEDISSHSRDYFSFEHNYMLDSSLELNLS